MTDYPTDTDIIAAHAPFDWNGGMYDCKCGWDEHPEDWDAYAAHVAEALTAARTIATETMQPDSPEWVAASNRLSLLIRDAARPDDWVPLDVRFRIADALLADGWRRPDSEDPS